MKFKKIVISKEISQEKGIKPINIHRLSNVVALIGKNGSGKTRILDLIEQHPFLLDTEFENIPKILLPNYDKYILLQELKIIEKERKKDFGNTAVQTRERRILDQLGKNDVNINSIIKSISDTTSKFFIRRIKQKEILSLQQILKQNADQVTFENLIDNALKNQNYNEFTSINESALKYLMNLPHKLVADDNECKGDYKKMHSRVAYQRFVSFQRNIKLLLNKDLEWEEKSKDGKFLDGQEGGFNVTYQGFFKLDGRELNYQEFSEGEKILFAYAILFFLIEQNKNLNIKECILIIDEPELHLHADSEIDLISKLREVISEKGQLIIATHSINILSSLNYEEIFVVKNGEIFHPSQDSFALSIKELLGIEEKVNKLSDLLSSVEDRAFINFVSQCLSNPDVIKSSTENDPQIESIKSMIKIKINKSNNILLDFGAGKGRVFENLLNDNDIFPKLQYHALEPKIEYHPDLKKLGISSIYVDYKDLPDNSFDFILLANVLHELPITSWELIINKIIDSLKDDGILMTIEVKMLSKGEKIDEAGFIILNDTDIQILFELPDDFQSFFIEDYKDKITSVMIQKSHLRKVTKKSIVDTLKKVQENSIANTRELLKGEIESPNSYSNGRKMAFHTMQFMNAQLSLEKITSQT